MSGGSSGDFYYQSSGRANLSLDKSAEFCYFNKKVSDD